MPNKETGILPNYSEPNIQIHEKVTPDGIRASLLVSDLPRFIDDLISLKPGENKSFIKYGSRKVEINIVNFDSGVKKL